MIAIVDYGVGNLRSAEKGLERAARAVGRDVAVRVTGERAAIERAEAVVLPGVGAFGACMKALRDSLLLDPVRAAALDGRPFLGICVGMQMLFEESREFGSERGLAVLPGRVTRLRSRGVKIPHMGWNSISIRSGFRLLDGIEEGTFFYFVHSYAVEPGEESLVAATADYGGATFAAAVGRGALFGTQFHPEKSQEAGIALLANFVRAAAGASAAISA